MAPAASILSSAAASGSKRTSDSDAAEPLDSLPQGGDEAARKTQQPRQQQLECPRCRSTNTKFCYYNNYSTAQPRHICRACRRYWTHGGALRDVPVGGASHRSKRRRVSVEPSSSPPPPPQTTAARGAEELSSSTLFPFLSDGSFFVLPPQLDQLGVAPAAFSWPSAAAPDFYYGLAPWDDDGTLGDGGVTGAWGGDIAGLELSWPPPGN